MFLVVMAEVEEWKQKHSRVFSSSIWVTFANHGQETHMSKLGGREPGGKEIEPACLVREIKLSNHMAREVGYRGREIGAINAIDLLHHDNRLTAMYNSKSRHTSFPSKFCTGSFDSNS